jgi:hypothetical protein
MSLFSRVRPLNLCGMTSDILQLQAGRLSYRRNLLQTNADTLPTPNYPATPITICSDSEPIQAACRPNVLLPGAT